ncbi:unnamed protein product [Protopolystoma xenopodis]|uniref:Transcription elongation factor SPT5 n=1 Tax=Protopolystoma xenopodis TaxID=117903 RepID=A0A3S5AEA9_9PLAT|nr:unnamed protein product [Protopolystoma xenopodis]
MVAGGIRPTLAELERFHQTPDGNQLALAAAHAVDTSLAFSDNGLLGLELGSGVGASNNAELVTHCFAPGDVVEVSEGDLKNLRGRVVSVDGNRRIIVQPNHSDLHEPIPFTALELRKYFNQGDHVKVI